MRDNDKNKLFVIAITNQKGGEGKTTTAVNLSFGLAKKNKKTLLIDMDPQANTTGVFIEQNSTEMNMFHVLSEKTSLEKVLVKTAYPNLFLAPSSINLAELETNSSNVNAPYALRDAIQSIKGFEYIIIDCPPSLSIFTINSLVASTHVIIPAQAEKFSVDGMNGLQSTINSIKKRINPKLEVIGALVTRLKPKTVLNKTILPVISQFFPVFDTTISEGVVIGESHLAKKSIFDYAPNARQAIEYKAFVEEAINVLEN